ncbi:hypothetical protein M2272_005570 [Mycobacterium frederiksbergense]|uniref:DUF4231 domain-containing protein n=1 Tax=Mycolicibacterium frederiksbergense TaxID=117567 RepID=A0ABT6L7I7_9MYCO|nr:DUF6611 family protein [Mycolicibacterium frederiksbergense]MDH6198906.1 hypothetical protein [Mycolicibacterium frederiksbergense]
MDRIGVRHKLAPLLDGSRSWGCVQVRPGRFGIINYRLVVYPPGLGVAERRWVRVARGWPLWGLLLWLLCETWLTGQMAPWPAFGVSAAICLAAGAIAFVLAGNAYHQVRTLGATTMAGFHDPEAAAARDRLTALAVALLEADERRRRGELSAVDHELIWWQVYTAMHADSAASTRRPS